MDGHYSHQNFLIFHIILAAMFGIEFRKKEEKPPDIEWK